MNNVKRFTAMVLAVMMIVSSFPLGVISFGSDQFGAGDTMSVPYYAGMTLDDLVKYINKGAGLDENIPVSEWSWYTNGAADYRYGLYLVDVDYQNQNDIFDIDIQRENVDVIKCLDIYRQYERGDITKEELEQNYSDVDLLFNDINIDADKLEATVADALDAARRDFRRERIYVPFEGKSNVVEKTIELDPATDPHCAFTVTIGSGFTTVTETLYLPTRLVIKGTETYSSILTAIANGQTVTVKHGEDTYKVKAYNVAYSDVVLTGKEGYVYPISYNVAAGDNEKDILDRIYDTVIDYAKSTLAEDFDREKMNGFTVRFYDKQTGWYLFDEQYTDRVKAGTVYDIELVYEGDTTDTVEFQIALFDPRVHPSIAIYGDEKLIVEYTDDVDAIKKAVFEALIDVSDLPEGVTYKDFDYFYMFGGYDSVANGVENSQFVDKKFNEFKDEYYDEMWETVCDLMEDHPVFELVSKEEFKEKYFTKEKFAELIREERWIDFAGGFTPITMEIEGQEVAIFEANFPQIYAAHNHCIKVVYRGNQDYASAEASTTEKVLQLTSIPSDIDLIDGCYEVESDILGNMVYESNGLDYTLIGLEIDTNFLEVKNVYITFPDIANTLGYIKVGEDTIFDGMDYLKKYLAMEGYKLSDILDLLDVLETSSNDKIAIFASVLKDMISTLPDSAFDAPVNYNGIPTEEPGTYLVASATTDLNGALGSYDYAVCFVVPSLESEYQIIYDNEIPYEGLIEDHDFDFTAHVYDNYFMPYEPDPVADSFYVGFPKGGGKMFLSYDAPLKKGQYLQISSSWVANPTYRYFDVALTRVTIEPSGDVFEYDGMPHGEPVIYDYMGEVVELNEKDRVIYANAVTGKYSTKAPSSVGKYNVTVIFSGRDNFAPDIANYQFEIVAKEVDLWIEDEVITYGDELPNFKLHSSIPEIIDQIEYTITPSIAYNGGVGEYDLIVTITKAPEGYHFNKLGGILTITQKKVTVEMNDVFIEYGEDFDPYEKGYYTVIEGNVVEGAPLGLVFEGYENAGVYSFMPVDYTNKNYDLTITAPGTLTVERKKIIINIYDAFMFEGDELPQFRFEGEVPEELVIYIAPSYFDMEQDAYILIGYTDNPNYEVVCNEGWLYVVPKPPVVVNVTVPDVTITYGDKLPEFIVETDVEIEGVRFMIEAADYEGDAGVYPLTVLAYGENEDNYRFNINAGNLIVKKKNVTVNIEDYTSEYGTPFDPSREYKITCDDPSVDMKQIRFEIGAEGYNGQAGKYLFVGMGISRNYNVTVKSATLTITPKDIVVTPLLGQGKFEGEADGEIKYEVEGLVGKDTLSGSLVREPGEEIGAYEILIGTLSNSNYTINFSKVYYGIRSLEYRSIRLDNLPENLVYLQGTALNTEGMKVVAVKANRQEVVLTPDQYDILGYDPSKLGEQLVTVHYKGHMAHFSVFVRPTEVLNVKVDKLPEKLVYIEGQEFSPEGATMVVFYDNGTYEYVDIEFAKFTGYDMNVIGKQSVTCEYAGKTDVFEITVLPKNAIGIELDTENAKLTFVEGMELDTTGLVVYLVYDNGTRVAITDSLEFEGYLNNVVGTQTITVKYGDFSAEYSVYVEKKSVIKLEVTYDGDELYVVLNSPFNPSQVKVIATYNDGTVKELEFGEYTVIGYDENSIGIWSAQIVCEEVSYDVKVRVVASEIKNIEITKAPANRVFYKGEALDLSGIEVTVNYYNGDKKVVEEWAVYGYDAEKLGKQVVTLSYLGYKHDLVVTVIPDTFTGIEIVNTPFNTVFTEKTKPDFTGLKINMLLGEEKQAIDFECLDFTGFDMAVIGKQTVTVVFGKGTAEFDIEIIEKEIEEIVAVVDETVVYLVGEVIDVNGFFVKVVYNNGEIEMVEMTADMVGEYDSSKVGRQRIDIKYGGKTTYVYAWFIKDEIIGLVITNPANKLVFKERTPFTADGIEVMVEYANGTFDKVYVDDCDYEADLTVIGKQTVTVKYAYAETNYDIQVISREMSQIDINTIPDKDVYVVGEEFDPTGLSIVVYYDNGEFEVVSDVSEFIIRGYNSEIPGECEVFVRYSGMETSFVVRIDPVTPVGIRIDATNANNIYYLHSMISLEGINVFLVHNDGHETTISADDCAVEGYDPFYLGKQNVKIRYGDFAADYRVEIIEGDVTGIEVDITEMPLVTVMGTPHIFDKMKVIAHYADGTSSRIVWQAYILEGYNYNKVGDQLVKITYNGFTAELELSVIPRFSLQAITEGLGSEYTAHDKGLLIKKVGQAVTIKEIKSLLNGGEYLVATDKNGELLDENDYIGTGSKITFVIDDTVYATYTVIVKGDLDGDGRLNITDAVIARHTIAKVITLDEYAIVAADVAENNGFNITDAILIRHKVANK